LVLVDGKERLFICKTKCCVKILQKINASNKRRRWQLNLSMYPSATYLVKYFTEEKGWGAVKVVLVH
jgi:hypothetical protein